jgi:uncharacterized Zn finger protein
MILPCTCSHEYQDLHYGPSQRVHNRCIKDRKNSYRCTVCGTVKGEFAIPGPMPETVPPGEHK